MAEALIHIGDAATNTWRDGDVIAVRTKDGTFSASEHRRPFAVIPLDGMTEAIALEYEKTGVVYDVFGEPMAGTENRRRKYRIDWRAILAAGGGKVDGKTVAERDVRAGKKIDWLRQSASSVMEAR